MSETIDNEVFGKQQSGGNKIFLWLLFLFLLLSCLCGLGLFGSFIYLFLSLENGLVEDPVVVQQRTEECFGELNVPKVVVKPRAFFTVKTFGKGMQVASIYSWDVTDRVGSAGSAKKSKGSAAEEDETSDSKSSTAGDDKGFVFFYSISSLPKKGELAVIKWFSNVVPFFAHGVSLTKYFDATTKHSETIPVTINGKANDFIFSERKSKDKEELLVITGSFVSKTNENCNVLICLPRVIPQDKIINLLENLQK